MKRGLRSNVINLSRNRSFKGTVRSVINDKVTVDFGNGRLVRGIPLVGGRAIVGQVVSVNYISGSPVAQCIGMTPIVPPPISLPVRPQVPVNPAPAGMLPTYIPITQGYLMEEGSYVSKVSRPGGNGMVDLDMSEYRPSAYTEVVAYLPDIAIGGLYVGLAVWEIGMGYGYNVQTEIWGCIPNEEESNFPYVTETHLEICGSNNFAATDGVAFVWDEGNVKSLRIKFTLTRVTGYPGVYVCGAILDWRPRAPT